MVPQDITFFDAYGKPIPKDEVNPSWAYPHVFELTESGEWREKSHRDGIVEFGKTADCAEDSN